MDRTTDVEIAPDPAVDPLGLPARPGSENAPGSENVTALALAELRAEMALLRRRAEANSLQIDDLQTADTGERRSWWRQPATILSVLALLASLAATLTSATIADSSRAAEARNRLTSIFQQINDIGRANQALAVEFGDRAPLNASAGSVRVLASDALRLAEAENLDIATADLTLLADAFLFAFELDTALELARDVVARTTVPVERFNALRTEALATFALGDVERGRAAFAEALALLDGGTITGLAPPVRDSTAAQLELQWAGSEYTTGDCPAARTHLDRSRAVLDGYDPAQVQLMIDQIDRAERVAASCA